MRIIILVMSLGCAQLHGATVFNVNYGSSGVPEISGPGGALPPPPGLPSASLLVANPPNSSHTAGIGDPLWIDSYDSGDYFSFTIIGVDPTDRIALTGLWFGTSAGPTGPTTVEVEMLSAGGGSHVVDASAPGVYVLSPTGVVSDTSEIEVRFTGIGGVSDMGGIRENFGIEFVSATFEVVPEPSTVLLSLAGALLFLSQRRRPAG